MNSLLFFRADDVAREKKKAVINPAELEAAIREIGLEHLIDIVGKGFKIL